MELIRSPNCLDYRYRIFELQISFVSQQNIYPHETKNFQDLQEFHNYN